ncbi:catalase-related domain-containing protein, partial [Chryseobacterium artocarpi]|uniref:catalase-related domain-containing protein n=1 Tax=Chryseobacterium artocarpi TaxID=1414727 RepID=UPI003F2E3755
QIVKGKSSYEPNSIGGGCPFQAMMSEGGFTSQQERISGEKVRERSKSFVDHYSQAKLFYNSQSTPEKLHLQNALIFELSKVTRPEIRERMVGQLGYVDMFLAWRVAEKVGVEVKKLEWSNQSLPADSNIIELQSEEREPKIKISEALSMQNTVKNTIQSRKIGFIIAGGGDAGAINDLKVKLEEKGAMVELIAPSLAPVRTNDGSTLLPKHSLTSTASVCFDALYIAGGEDAVKELLIPENRHLVLHFINEAYKHCKAIYFGTDTQVLYHNSNVSAKQHDDPGIITWEDGDQTDKFINAIAKHRVWDHEMERNA